MASEEHVEYRMDPAEMLSPSSVRVHSAGTDVVVEINRCGAGRPVEPPSGDHHRAAA